MTDEVEEDNRPWPHMDPATIIERGKNGFAHTDCWNLDDYLAKVISKSLEEYIPSANAIIVIPPEQLAIMEDVRDYFLNYEEIKGKCDFTPEASAEWVKRNAKAFQDLSEIFPGLWW